MFQRNVYLSTVSPTEARARIFASVNREELIVSEVIPAQEASGRVLAQAVSARHSSPIAHCAAMDGYAVHSLATFMARESKPVYLVEGEQCFAVNTGNPLPQGCDAVIMIEHVVKRENGIDIEHPVYPWQHVRRIGEDIVATELLFSQNHLVQAWDVGALLSGGVWDVNVWQKPLVRIIPTGDEILDFSKRPEPGKGEVVESNSQVLTALLHQMGCLVECLKPVPDNPELLHKALLHALDSKAHMVIVCAGSSAGSKDYTRSILEKEGTVLVHGLAIMPGKPSLVANCHGKPVFGAPGYPVSTLVCYEELIKPTLAWLTRRPVPQKPCIELRLTRSIPSQIGKVERVFLSVGRVGEVYIGTPLGRGAGNITSVTRGQASVDVPAISEGFTEGQSVKAALHIPEESLQRNLVCVGSHDNTLDVLADELMALPEAFGLVSAHVGSMGGLNALKNGFCHFSGMHLFDTESGDFNFPFLKQFIPNQEVLVVNLAIRHQGLMVLPGNPLEITELRDLIRVRFINRQRGAGTRILLDHLLKQQEIAGQRIQGYEKEEATHMAVAANVLAGTADCCMGIHAAAQALGLDFIPLTKERYDLVIPLKFSEDVGVQSLLTLLKNPVCLERIQGLGGYETTLTGQVMQPGQGLHRV